METKCPHTPKCSAGYCWADEKPKVNTHTGLPEEYSPFVPREKYEKAVTALTAAEAALLDASYALPDGAPAKRGVVEALKLVRDTLGVGPRWLDGKPKG